MDGFEKSMTEAVDDGTILGAVVFAKDTTGKINYTHSFGSRRATPSPQPMEPDTVFMIASMTKLLTTIAVLQLVEKGLTTLDADVTPLLPVLAKQDILTGFSADGAPQTGSRRERPISLRQLLTHSYGGGYEFLSPELARWRESRGAASGGTVDEVFGTPLLYQPGTSWTYGPGLDWAGQVVEVLSGQTLEEYMKAHIFTPLSLSDITFWPSSKPQSYEDRRAAMSIRDAETGRATQSRKPINISANMTQAAGGQGAFATMSDYIAILHSLLTDDERLLGRATSALMFRPQLEAGARAALRDNFRHPDWAVGHFPDTGEYDWGLGGLLIDGDSHAYRKRGALMWSGNANLTWFIDRTAGVCGVFGCQLLPPADLKVEELIKGFEEGIYGLAGVKTKL